MANKEQIQKALDELWTRYGNTLSMLTDAIDKIDEKISPMAPEPPIPAKTICLTSLNSIFLWLK